MAVQKVNIRFHNPNGTRESADYIGKIFIEATRRRLETITAEKKPPEFKRRE